MTLSTQSQDGKIAEGMPNSQITARGTEEPERDPQQKDQPDTTGGKVITDYNLDIDYEGSEPKAKQSAPEQREVDPDAEYANMEIP